MRGVFGMFSCPLKQLSRVFDNYGCVNTESVYCEKLVRMSFMASIYREVFYLSGRCCLISKN